MSHIVLTVDGSVVFESGATVAVDNPFIAWKAEGFDLVQVAMWKLGRGLTAAELQQAAAAGYSVAGQDTSPGEDVFSRPPYPSYWAHDFTAAGQQASPVFAAPAGRYQIVGTVDGVGAATIAIPGVFDIPLALTLQETVSLPGGPLSALIAASGPCRITLNFKPA